MTSLFATLNVCMYIIVVQTLISTTLDVLLLILTELSNCQILWEQRKNRDEFQDLLLPAD